MIYIPTTDEEYFGWIKNRPEGFIVNSDKAASDNDLPMLHTSKCSHVNYEGWPGYVQSKTFKLCSTNREELRKWVMETDKRELKICKSCAP